MQVKVGRQQISQTEVCSQVFTAFDHCWCASLGTYRWAYCAELYKTVLSSAHALLPSTSALPASVTVHRCLEWFVTSDNKMAAGLRFQSSPSAPDQKFPVDFRLSYRWPHYRGVQIVASTYQGLCVHTCTCV